MHLHENTMTHDETVVNIQKGIFLADPEAKNFCAMPAAVWSYFHDWLWPWMTQRNRATQWPSCGAQDGFDQPPRDHSIQLEPLNGDLHERRVFLAGFVAPIDPFVGEGQTPQKIGRNSNQKKGAPSKGSRYHISDVFF